jgi:hypothetical protein
MRCGLLNDVGEVFARRNDKDSTAGTLLYRRYFVVTALAHGAG